MSRIIRNPSVVQGSLSYGAALTPPNITANTNNYNPAGLGDTVLLRLIATGNYNLTGLVPPDITQSRQIFIYNVGTKSITLKNNDAGSTASNRFLFGADKKIQADEGIGIVYDTVSQRWRAFGINT